jgi:thiol-disulfide isomerase/thioredoxin
MTDSTPSEEMLSDDTADTEAAGSAPAPRRRRSRRGREVRIGFPGWAPFAFVAVFAAGVVLGAVLALVIEDDDSGTAAATTEATVAPRPVSGDGSPSPAPIAADAAVDDPLGYGSVEIVGTPLPRLGDGGQADPAVGMPAPGLAGADFEGTPVAISDDGQAKLIVFLAHWCPYCREEVPRIRDWVQTTEFPGNVDIYSVATLTQPDRANYPPATWLALEGWNVPLLADDGADTAAVAFGLNAVPFWVLVNGDNTIAGRGAGAVPVDVLTQVVADLSAAAS